MNTQFQYIVHLGTRDQTKYLICELSEAQLLQPQVMYKVADYINALHVSSNLQFNFTLLFIAYGKELVNNKYLLYTDLNSDLNSEWKVLIKMLDDLVQKPDKTHYRNVFQIDQVKSNIAIKADTEIDRKCFDQIYEQLATSNNLQGIKYQVKQ